MRDLPVPNHYNKFCNTESRHTETFHTESTQTNKDKFKCLGGVLGPTCVSRNKSVNRIEEINACGVIWHKSCFLCGEAPNALNKII